MKKIYGFALLAVLLLGMNSCKNEKSKSKKNVEKGYTLDAKTSSVNWTAYKTTEKVPVKGKFTAIELTQKKEATKLEALNNVKFSIPVSSIFTKDTIRDKKIIKFFFNNMIKTQNILGSFNLDKDTNTGTLNLTMNGITQPVSISYTINDQLVTFEGTLNLDNWQAQTALKALNTACKVLHTGKDGVSKTWEEVKIEGATYLKYD